MSTVVTHQNDSVPVSVLLKEKQKSQNEAPRLTATSLIAALKSIERRWNDLGTELRFPQTVMQDIERQNLSLRERLSAVLRHFLKLHPFASWRRIIRALERLEENSLVKHIKHYAERILDPSFTVDNVVRVISVISGNWKDGVYAYGLAGELLVPVTVQEKIVKRHSSVKDQQIALAKYWVRIVFNASWPTLAGALHFLGEKAALAICVNDYLDVEQDESLTFENLLAAFEGVTKWAEIGYRLRVPTPKQNEIRSKYPSDEQRKEAVLKEFLVNHPAPTWKEAALALYRMRHHNMVETLYNKKYLIAPEEQRLLDVFNYAIKQKGYLNQRIMQATIQGNARSGKTSLIKVLQGKKARPSEPSTAVMEESARIELSQSAVLVDGIEWKPVKDLNEEATIVVREVMTKEQIQANESLIEDSFINTDTTGLSTVESEISETAALSEFSTVTSSSIESLPWETIDHSPENSTVSNVFKLAVKKAKLEMTMIKDPWTVYISDVGGQLEFQELVPALTNGPSIHIVVIAAHWGLNNRCPIEYLHKNGESAVSYEANYTVKENVLLTLATIMSTGHQKHTPKVIFVITFKDFVTEQHLVQMDEELQQAIKPTKAFRSGAVEFCSKSRLCHSINNLSPDKEDISSIRKTVERIGNRDKDSPYNVETPYTWLCFSLALRGMKERVLHYSTCVEVGKQCGIDSIEELSAALHFLHYNVGVIRYFSDVPELSDIVIKEPQLLFDCVTELVVNTFTFERVNYSAHEDFQKKGLFPVTMVKKISTDSTILTVEKLIAFLMHHHIVAPLEEGGEIVKYFLPCSLVHAQVNSFISLFDLIPSLIVTFNTGYTPRGIFGFLVCDLLTDKGHELDIVLDVDCIYRDQLTVSVGPYVDKFCFSLHASYIKIDVQPSNIERKFPFGVVCCYVRGRVVEALKEIVSKLNYNCEATHLLAFVCPDKCGSIQAHPAIVSSYRDEVQAMKCTVNKTAKSLPKGYAVWFNKDECIPRRKRPAAELPPAHPKRIEIDRNMDNNQNGTLMSDTKTTRGRLSVSQLNQLRILLWRAKPEWERIGIALHIDQSTLKAIEIKHHYKPEECFTEMLYLWLCQENPPATLGSLKEALDSLSSIHNYRDLENEMERNITQDPHLLSTVRGEVTVNDLKWIVTAVWQARVKWFDIGIALLNDVPTLESIRVKHRDNPDECLRETLTKWLQMESSTLEDLMRSVQTLPVRECYPGLEREIEKAIPI